MLMLGSGEQWSPLLGVVSSILASAGPGGTVAYTQARKSKTKGTRYVGYYLDANGKPKVAGTFATDDEALRVAQGQEDHVRERRTGTPPAAKATITIEEFARDRFLPRIEITPKAKQTYKSHLKNHIYPYLGRE